MILTSGYTKGGVGKTTCAINIAIARALAGKDVLLVDGDEQQTAAAFTAVRCAGRENGAGYAAVSLAGAAIRQQVKQLAPKYDEVVIDAGGRDTSGLRAALTVSDVLLVPVQPGTFDVWEIEKMGDLVEECLSVNPTLRAYSFINCADAQGTDNEEAAKALRDERRIIFLEERVGRRKAFRKAADAGASVIEHQPTDAKAVSEIIAIISKIYQ